MIYLYPHFFTYHRTDLNNNFYVRQLVRQKWFYDKPTSKIYIEAQIFNYFIQVQFNYVKLMYERHYKTHLKNGLHI